MPFFAKRRSDGKTVKPSQASKADDLACRTCDSSMVLYDSYEDKHGVFVSSHFKHKPGSTGSETGCAGGESDRHLELKEIALHKLQWKFDLAHSTTEQRVGECIADVYGRFSEPKAPYGFGIVVEVQYRNKGKDIEAVTKNYLEHGYSVFWVWEAQFDGMDVDFSAGDVRTVWPDAAPRRREWSGVFEVDDPETSEPFTINSQGEKTSVQARIPFEWYWRDLEWADLFPDRDGYDSWEYIDEVRNTIEHPDKTVVTFAPDIVASLQFDELKDRYPSASTPKEMQYHFWRGSYWSDRFRPQSGPPATTDPDLPARFFLSKWLTDEGTVLHLRDRGVTRDEPTSMWPAPPAEDCLIPEALLDDIYERINLSRINMPDPDPPSNPFDDVQCRFCGVYWNVERERDSCNRCGEDVDWRWNVETGRIPERLAPEGALD